MNVKEKKAEAKSLKPIMRIGKHGINENIIDDINDHLKKRKLIKIKLLKSFRDKDTNKIAKEIAEKTNSKIVDIIGFVFVLYKK